MTPSTPQATTRRTVLRRAAVAAAALGLPAAASARQATQNVVVPRIDAVEEYGAQMLFVGGLDHENAEDVPEEDDPGDLPEDDPSAVPVDQCGFDAWPADRTAAVDALFVDRLAEESVSYGIQVYVNGDDNVLEEGQYYLLQQPSSCSDSYVGARVEQVPAEEGVNVDPGEENGSDGVQTPGEEVTPAEAATETVDSTDTPGFGVLAAVAGVATALAARALGREE